MKAMILAAGFGTRLQPLTQHRPKALIPVAGRPLIDRTIDYLESYGVEEIVVNAHHLYPQMLAHLERPRRIPIHVVVERRILGTAGGIKNAERFWDHRPIIVINGDVLTDLDLSRAWDAHHRSGALATLVLHDCPPFNQIRAAECGRIQDIAAHSAPGRLAFTGIHVLRPSILDHVPSGRFADIIEVYRHCLRQGERLQGHVAEGITWADLGTVDRYLEANREALGDRRFYVGPSAQVHHTAQLEQWAVIGRDCWIERGAVVARSVLWEGVRVMAGCRVQDSAISSGRCVEHDLIGATL